MADVKITGLPEDTSPTGDDFTVSVDTGSGATKKVKWSNLSNIFATPDAAQVFTDSFVQKRVASVTSSSSPTPDADTTDVYLVTALATSADFGTPTGAPTEGQPLILRIKDDGTAQSLTYSSSYRAIGVTLPTTTVANKTIYIGLIYNDEDTCWDVVGIRRQS